MAIEFTLICDGCGARGRSTRCDGLACSRVAEQLRGSDSSFRRFRRRPTEPMADLCDACAALAVAETRAKARGK